MADDMKAWFAHLRSTVSDAWRAWHYSPREPKPLPEGGPVDQAEAISVLRGADVERLTWSARQLGFTARSVHRFETIGLALAAGSPVPIEALSRQPRAVLRATRKYGPRHIVGGTGRCRKEAYVVAVSDMELMIELLLRTTPTRYATGAELRRDDLHGGPPSSTTPNPRPRRPSTKEPQDCAPSKDDE